MYIKYIYMCVCVLTPGDTTDRQIYSHIKKLQFSSVHFSRSVMSDSLQPHELQHAKPPCPSPTPRVHPNYVP